MEGPKGIERQALWLDVKEPWETGSSGYHLQGSHKNAPDISQMWISNNNASWVSTHMGMYPPSVF